MYKDNQILRTNHSTKMLASERRSVLIIAGLYSIRMLGLFMLLPVLSLYQDSITGATSLLIGVAIGIYGLTQACMQLPFGIISDRLGRKPLLIIGVVLFGIGSVVGALSDDILGIIIARALQGCGAIASVLMAFLADKTSEQVRTKATALVGMSIGGAFQLALILGPLLSALYGLASLFWMCAVLSVLAIVVILIYIPSERNSHQPVRQYRLRHIFKQSTLLRLAFGVFVLHLILTASFIVIPKVLHDHIGLAQEFHAWVYLIILPISFVLMLPLLLLIDRRYPIKGLVVAIGLLAIAQGLLGGFFADAGIWVYGFLLLFFIAFNYLEAMLPSLASKSAPEQARGAAMGVFSTSQFLGAFSGGIIGGWVNQYFGIDSVFYICMALAILWGFMNFGLKIEISASSTVSND